MDGERAKEISHPQIKRAFQVPSVLPLQRTNLWPSWTSCRLTFVLLMLSGLHGLPTL